MNVLPLPGELTQADLAAEQPGDLAADRQAQARAAVLAAGAAVGLLERLEDDLLLVRRDADAGVATPRTPAPSAARFRSSFSGLQPSRAGSTVSETRPWWVNLKALESRFLMTCWSRLASVKIACGRSGPSSMANSTPFDSATWRNVRST